MSMIEMASADGVQRCPRPLISWIVWWLPFSAAEADLIAARGIRCSGGANICGIKSKRTFFIMIRLAVSANCKFSYKSSPQFIPHPITVMNHICRSIVAYYSFHPGPTPRDCVIILPPCLFPVPVPTSLDFFGKISDDSSLGFRHIPPHSACFCGYFVVRFAFFISCVLLFRYKYEIFSLLWIVIHNPSFPFPLRGTSPENQIQLRHVKYFI